MYETICKCPVCGKEMGRAQHPEQKIDAQAAAWIFGDYRRDHANATCVQNQAWSRGWVTETHEIAPDAQAPNHYIERDGELDE